jgi:hypothetical protein
LRKEKWRFLGNYTVWRRNAKCPIWVGIKGAIGAFYGSGGGCRKKLLETKKLKGESFGLSPLRGKDFRKGI